MAVPKPNASASSSNSPFLKAAMIGKKPTTISLTGGPVVLVDGTYGEQLKVPVTFKGKPYTWAFGVNSGNHTRLFKRFGPNEKKWKGAIKVGVKEFNGAEYVAVLD